MTAPAMAQASTGASSSSSSRPTGHPRSRPLMSIAVASASPPMAHVGDVQQPRRALAGHIATAVVARGGGNVSVTRHPLHGGQVGAGVEQVADEGAPEVVGRQLRHRPPEPGAWRARAPPGGRPGAAASRPARRRRRPPAAPGRTRSVDGAGTQSARWAAQPPPPSSPWGRCVRRLDRHVPIARGARDAERLADLRDGVALAVVQRPRHRHLRRRGQLLGPAPLTATRACSNGLQVIMDVLEYALGHNIGGQLSVADAGRVPWGVPLRMPHVAGKTAQDTSAIDITTTCSPRS